MSRSAAGASRLSAEVVTGLDDLTSIEDDWHRLAELRGNPFVAPEWFRAALETVDNGASPCVVVVRDGAGEVSGVMGLLRHGRGALRFAGARFADRLHPAARPGAEDAVAAEAGAALARAVGRYHSIAVDRVDIHATWPRALGRARRPVLRSVAQPVEGLPYVAIEGRSWDDYMASRSRGLRSQVGRKRRALEREHDVSFTWIGEPDQLGRGMDELFRLHDLRWVGRQSSMNDPHARGLLRRFGASALERGWLRLCLLEVDGAVIAAWYGWNVGGRFAYYQAGFDPEWSRSSPGLLLLAETVRMATEEGASEYDLLRGEEEFKRRFATGTRHVQSLLLAPATHPALVRAATASGLRGVWRLLPAGGRTRLRRRLGLG
jgi:CelD/BcsL family acetyltransferase involved in cellulose biosynthesis